MIHRHVGLRSFAALQHDRAILARRRPGIAAIEGWRSNAIAFTAGIGENSRALRERVCRDSRWLSLERDEAANASNGPRIGTDASRASAWVIPTNEELMIATRATAPGRGASADGAIGTGVLMPLSLVT